MSAVAKFEASAGSAGSTSARPVAWITRWVLVRATPALSSTDTETTPAASADPALIAASILLQHALSVGGLPAKMVGLDGVVTIINLPGVVWTPVVVTMWSSTMRDDESKNSDARSSSASYGAKTTKLHFQT